MGWLGDVTGCGSGAVQYGTQGAVLGSAVGSAAGGTGGAIAGGGVGAVPGVAAGAAVGGEIGAVAGSLYGCFLAPDTAFGKKVEKLARAAKRYWAPVGKTIKRGYDVVADLFGLGNKKKKKKTPPAPLTTDEAMALAVRSFTERPGNNIKIEGKDGVWRDTVVSRIFHPSVLQDLWGENAIGWTPRRVEKMLWAFWQRTTRSHPALSAEVRMMVCVLTLGDFALRGAPASRPETWPILPGASVSAPEIIQEGARGTKTASSSATPGKTSEAVDLTTDLVLFGVVSLLALSVTK